MVLARKLVLGGILLALVCGSLGATGKLCRGGCCRSKMGKYMVTKCDLRQRGGKLKIPKKNKNSQIQHFSHGSHGTVEHHGLDHLVEILLTDIRKLTFLGSSDIRAERKHRGPTVTNSKMIIDGVEDLQLGSNSLNGWQNADSLVWIKNIKNCRIDASAFARSTKIKRLILQNITNLELAEDAIQASVNETVLRNVTITECPRGAFGGRLVHLQTLASRLNVVRSGCLSSEGERQTLTLRNSQLDQVKEHGITGAFEHVMMAGCNISALHSHGIQVNVSHFSMNAVSIGDLHPDGLEVQADQAVSLQGLNVSRLHGNGFRGLRVVGESNRGINITGLTVARADNDSLTFADGADVRVRMLVFNIYKECDKIGNWVMDRVHVESAWQPPSRLTNVTARIHTFFEPLFACDLESALDSTYPNISRSENSSSERQKET